MFDSAPSLPPTRDRLIGAAADLMRRQSYATVSVDEICRAAEIKKGTFYHHFPSKVELALVTFDHLWAEARAGILACARDAALSGPERLARFAASVVACHRETFDKEGKVYGCPFSSAGTEMGAQNEKIRLKMVDIFDDAVSLLADLAAAMPGHDKAPRAASLATARAMMCLIMGVEYQAKIANDPDVIARDLLPGLRRLLALPPTE